MAVIIDRAILESVCIKPCVLGDIATFPPVGHLCKLCGSSGEYIPSQLPHRIDCPLHSRRDNRTLVREMAEAITRAWNSHFGDGKSFADLDAMTQACRMAEAEAALEVIKGK